MEWMILRTNPPLSRAKGWVSTTLAFLATPSFVFVVPYAQIVFSMDGE